MTTKTMSKNMLLERLKSWDEIVAYGLDLRAERDERTWELGALAAYACPENPKGGRPHNGQENHTLAALAAAWGEQPAAVSAWYWNCKFWGDRWHNFPDLSWRQFSEARRRSGWRPGVEITDEHRTRAMQFVAEYDAHTPPRPLFVFADWAERERERILAKVPHAPNKHSADCLKLAANALSDARN